MLSSRAQEVVSQTAPGRRVSLIVSVRPQAELARVSAISDRKERLSKLLKLYTRKKLPLLKQFGAYEAAGLRIIDPLVGTPDILVSAPARVWRRVIRDKPQFVRDPAVEWRANEAEFVASVEVGVSQAA